MMNSTDQAGEAPIDWIADGAPAVVDLRDSTARPVAGSDGQAVEPDSGAVGFQQAADPAASASAEGDEPGDQEELPVDLLAGIELSAALEALLIISAEAMTAADLAVATGVPEPEVEAALSELAAQYLTHSRGFELRSVAGAWRFYSAAHCAPVVHRWVTDGRQSRLSQAALETLAVVAYQQPVSRAKVGAIRGVNVDGVMRTLHARGLVTETGSDPHTGATLYGTTDYFLERMGLSDLSGLPPIGDLLPDPSDVTDHIDGEALDLP